MKAKIQRYVDRTARQERRLEAMLRGAVRPSTGVTTVPARMAPPRRALRALWRHSPVTGRLEMSWQAADAEQAADTEWAADTVWEPQSSGHPVAA